MATRKTSTRRKTTTRRKKVIGETIKIAGAGGKKRTYKRTACGPKSYLATLANTVRASGGTARVIETSPGKFCLYKGPKSAVKRSKVSGVAGRRRKRRTA